MISIRNNKGSATILIMLMSAVIITVGLGFNWLVKEHIKASEGLKNKAEAILKARSAYDTLIYLILNGQVSQKELVLSGIQGLTKLTAIPLNGKEVPLDNDLFVRVQESNGLVPLSDINGVVLERLIRKVGGLANAAIPVESLLDWIDRDDFSRVNGAEKNYYRSQEGGVQPRNYALQYKEELIFIRDIGRDLYRKIEPFVTMLPVTGFNPNTAGDEVLRAYLDINDESLKMVKEYLSVSSLSSDTALFFLTGRQVPSRGEEVNYYPSRYMEITVRVGSPRSLYTIRAGLNFMNNPNAPYTVLYWREE